MSNVSRRELVGGSLAAGIGLLAGRAFGAPAPSSIRKSFRFAHLTDLHILGDISRVEVSRALEHAVGNKPEMILTGGDLIYDAAARSKRCVTRQWSQFHRAFEGCRIKTEHMIGNHDIWGLVRSTSKTTGAEPLYGKKWAMEELQLPQIHRSFLVGGWKFILLDDVHPVPDKGTYELRLDEAQLGWLSDELKSTPEDVPVVIVSHGPILAANVFFLPYCDHQVSWSMPFALMNADTQRLTALFEQHSNVKLCLNGHTHLGGRVDYKNVAYVSHGAVCGDWWHGPFQNFAPGYGLVDLFPDGTFETRYLDYAA